MKWTDEINKNLLLCYFTVTNLQQNTTAYRSQLHQAFINIYPELRETITEQRLSDQIRVIVRNNRIPPAEREIIRRQAADSLQTVHKPQEKQPATIPNTHTDTVETLSTQPTETQKQTTSAETSTSHTQHKTSTITAETPQPTNQIEETYNEIHIQYQGTDPLSRPFIKRPQNIHNIKNTITTINQIIEKRIEESTNGPNIEELLTLVYCGAATATRLHEQPNTKDNSTKKKPTIPSWQRRLQKKIATLRKEIGIITQYSMGNLKKRPPQNLLPENRSSETIIEILDTKKQQLQAQTKRLKRYKKSYQRKQENKLFNTNEKKFYRTLQTTEQQMNNPPPIIELKSYWANIWSQAVTHNRKAQWITDEETTQTSTTPMPNTTITLEDVKNALSRAHNWKAPGDDKIQNFWLKSFTSIHQPLTKIFQNFIQEAEAIPPFLTQGVTYLKPKDADTANPSKYRPITCLSTTYKILTAIITTKINTHLENNNIMAEEQKGCCKRSRGCKEQLVIDAEIHTQAKLKRKSLHYAYIDYQKAFDSIPHSWLIHALQIYKIHPQITKFLETVMSTWRTSLNIKTNKENIRTEPIQIKRGIFQGDSLSALWFCIALNPLSNILNKTREGYKLTSRHPHTISHLLYMDDLKLYTSTRNQLNNLLKVTEIYSQDIQMKLGTDKCKINSIINGKHSTEKKYTLQDSNIIKNMEADEAYKYLGYLQKTGIEHANIKQQLKNKYQDRIKQILKTELSGRNKVKAVNTYATPILTYSFGIIKWNDTELEELNRLTRTTCNKYRIHHIHTAVERFTLKRKDGGRGFIDLKNMNYKQINTLKEYFKTKAETSPLHRSIINLTTSGTPMKFNIETQTLVDTNTTNKIEKWKSKALHGKHPYQLTQPHIDTAASNAWLTRGNLYGETEGFMVAIQDQIIATRSYQKHIIKDPNTPTDKCRLCHTQIETIEHITGGCTVLAPKQYTQRHDSVGRIIHQEIAKKYSLITNHTPYYKYQPENILENNTAKLYWNRDIITDKTTPHNKPDITLIHKTTKTTYLIEIAIPNSPNIQKKHTEKIEKYLPLTEEIRQMWHQDIVKIVPIIISSTGLIPKTLHDSLKGLELPSNLYIPMQKAVILHTCNITRQVLSMQ